MKCLVVGCGLSGAVIARELAEKNFEVEILERRAHIAGNLYDYKDEYGVLVHKYGPHTFHTNDYSLFSYISKYHKWHDYKLMCGAEINGIITPTPFNFKTIDQFLSVNDASRLKSKLREHFGERERVTILEVLNSESKIIRDYGNFLFDNDYRPYTAKQWGIPPQLIDPSILKRVPIRLGYDEGYFDDLIQVMPEVSYVSFFEELLRHRNISVNLCVDAVDHLEIDTKIKKIYFDKKEITYPIVYTGALDELFGFEFGSLPYRSLRFEWYHADVPEVQPYAVVAFPQKDGFTRVVEFNKLPIQNCIGTTYEVEYPLEYLHGSNMEPYYPVLTQQSIAIHRQYLDCAKEIKNFFCCGRLAEFKYYNMDQALRAALDVSKQIIKQYQS